MRPKRFLGLWYVQCKSFTNLASRLHSLQMDQNELPLDACHLVLPSGASKTISEPMVRLKQTVHLSCIDTYTVSEWTKTRFHMTHITEEFHRVRPKRFLSLWYVWCKLCTYLALGLHYL